MKIQAIVGYVILVLLLAIISSNEAYAAKQMSFEEKQEYVADVKSSLFRGTVVNTIRNSSETTSTDIIGFILKIVISTAAGGIIGLVLVGELGGIIGLLIGLGSGLVIANASLAEKTEQLTLLASNVASLDTHYVNIEYAFEVKNNMFAKTTQFDINFLENAFQPGRSIRIVTDMPLGTTTSVPAQLIYFDKERIPYLDYWPEE